MSLTICSECNKRAVVGGYAMQEEHVKSCLNCGFHIHTSFLDVEEIDNLRENYTEEFELLKTNGIIEISKENTNKEE